jgi:hypothetical protein
VKYDAMTGAAHTSSTASIFQRPARGALRLAPPIASCGVGQRMHGQAQRLVKRAGRLHGARGRRQLEPDIKEVIRPLSPNH